MFYRTIALALVFLGAYEVISHLSFPVEINSKNLGRSAVGIATIFLGLLNWVYAYDAPESAVPKYTLLAANILFIGFAILLITSKMDVYHGYIALALSLANSVMVLNHKL